VFGRVHVGDMANLVCTYAIDGERSVIAPVTLEAHSLIGAAAVALPGTMLGKSATLGAGAASLAGVQLPGAHLPPFTSLHMFSGCILLSFLRPKTSLKAVPGITSHQCAMKMLSE
jgi:hypothetical protein